MIDNVPITSISNKQIQAKEKINLECKKCLMELVCFFLDLMREQGLGLAQHNTKWRVSHRLEHVLLQRDDS
jgi:hypothetical protein